MHHRQAPTKSVPVLQVSEMFDHGHEKRSRAGALYCRRPPLFAGSFRGFLYFYRTMPYMAYETNNNNISVGYIILYSHI